MINTLSTNYVFLSTLNAKLYGLEYVKYFYANGSDDVDVYNSYEKSTYGRFYKLDGYLFRKNEILCLIVLCVFLMHEAHGGGFIGNFGVRKTLKFCMNNLLV